MPLLAIDIISLVNAIDVFKATVKIIVMRYFVICLIFLGMVSCSSEDSNGSNPTVSISDVTIQEGSSNNKVSVNVRLSKASVESVTIFVETADGSAVADEDYLSLSRSVEFQPGSTSEDVEVDIIGDDFAELDEIFTVSIVNVSGANIGEGTATITITNDDGEIGALRIPETGYSTPEAYDGWDLIWSDEFEGTALDENFWTYEIGNGTWGWGNNELQYYRRDNTSIVDGHLVIEAKEEEFGGFNYTSSRLITRDKFEFQYGRVDIRAALPEGQGLWPALWMLGANFPQVGWPRCGEIDIMEITGDQPSKLLGTVHYSNPTGQRLLNEGSTQLPNGEKFSDEFHVFSLVWEEDRILFLLDDVQYHGISRAGLGGSNPYPFNDPFFFIFNVAVGGTLPGSPDATTMFPQRMIVDYVRVFQEN